MKFGLRELVFVGVILGLLVSSWLFLFKVNNEKRVQIQAEIAQKQKALIDLQQSTTGIADLSNKITELQKAIDFFESKLPQAKEVDAVLNQVCQLAEANALENRTFKTMKTERAATYSELPIQMTLNGDFNGFYTFLQQLEKLPRITRLTNMTLQKAADKDGHMQANLTLSIFFEPDADAPRIAGSN